jgi:hypothetical protein
VWQATFGCHFPTVLNFTFAAVLLLHAAAALLLVYFFSSARLARRW